MFTYRILIALFVLLGLQLGNSAQAKVPTIDELYKIVLVQQNAIKRLEQMIRNMNHHGGESNNEHHRQIHPSEALEPLDLKSKEGMPPRTAAPATRDTMNEVSSPDSPAQQTDAPSNVDQPKRTNSGFYLMARAEYSIPENIDVNNNVGQGEAILSDGVSLGFGLGYRFN